MLADLLEREVKKEPGLNGAATSVTGKELRISDNGLELIPKEARGRFAVDMGVVGMNDLTGVDLGDGAAAPKAAHLIAQVDDSGHVQIHLEEEADGSSMCNGQSLLDQLEACEVSSSTDAAPSAGKGVKRPAEPVEESKSSPTPVKRAMTLNKHPGENLTNDESTPVDQPATEKAVNGVVVNGVGPADAAVATPTAVTTAGSSQPAPQPVVLGPNAPRTFLILQPQTQQQVNLAGFHPQGQRLLLAIQRPGGVVQHVAMPANVVAISSSQIQSNGGVMTLTTSGGIATAVVSTHAPITLSAGQSSAGAITTVASSSSTMVTTASVDGMVTFSGGAVAFPARPTENSSRTSSPGESHVTITPVSAAPLTPASTPGSTVNTSATGSPVVVTSVAAAAAKKRTASVDSPKPRGRPAKNKSIDAPPTSTPPPPATVAAGAPSAAAPVASPSPSPQPPPFNPTHQYLCEWKDCLKAFKTPHEVYVHACHVHCPASIDELGCLWDRCDGLKRRRFSMMTHLMDRHCNDEVLTSETLSLSPDIS